MPNTIVVTWTEWLENPTVNRLAEGVSTEAYFDTLPPERTAFAFDLDADDWLGAQWRERFTCPQLVQIFNTVRDQTVPAVTKFESKDVALRRIAGQLVARARESHIVGEVPAQPREEKKMSESKRRGRQPGGNFRPDAVITVLAAENPKKAGSKVAERFAKLQTGMTVAAAREIGFSTHDLEWDANHGFISVEA